MKLGKEIREFWKDEQGVGVIELVLVDVYKRQEFRSGAPRPGHSGPGGSSLPDCFHDVKHMLHLPDIDRNSISGKWHLMHVGRQN